MAVELASAYVSVIPTTKGLQANLERELSPLTGAASKAGADSGNALGNSFTGASGGFKSSVAEAEGHIGKFKAGATSALDSVGISTGMLATAGGAALIGFGVKAVGAFTDTAKAALDLSTSVGTNVEDASRWIGVADDYGISADTLQGSLGKVSKTIDDTKWAEFGVATRDAGGQVRPVNDILLDTFDKLSAMTNEGDRAREGAKLFGKGYGAIAPLIGHTRDEYEKMLGAVEKGQVITAEEAKKAERMRLAQDQLHDAFQEVTLAIGEQVANMAPYLVTLAKAVDLVAKVFGTANQSVQDFNADKAGEVLHKLNDEIVAGGKDWIYWAEQVAGGKVTLDDAVSQIHAAASAHGDLALSQKQQADQAAETARETRKIPPAWQEVADATDAAKLADQQYKANSDNTKRAVTLNLAEIEGKWAELTGTVNDDKAWVTLQGQFDQVKAKFEEANTAVKDGTDDAAAKTLEYKGALDDLILSSVDYAKAVKDIPPEKLVNVKAALDAGELQRAEDMLAILTRNRSINIDLIGKGAAGFGGLSGARAGGGWAQGSYLVGEDGPELATFKRPTYISTAAETETLLAHRAYSSSLARVGGTEPRASQTINVNNNGREFTINDMNHVLAMARLS